ncbi:MAG: pectinesterase family protein [Bacteroidales bacterium]|nr:pectinesterase family protein [Bacteroidales bacterium]
MKKFAILAIMALALGLGANAQPKIVLRLMGDSTMADKDLSKQNPERGWGQRLPADLDTNVVVVNYAKNGRSTKSAISEGIWDNVKNDLKAGEYLFIEFGHNDAKDEDSTRYAPAFGLYTENLKTFAQHALSVGAKPIIFSPLMRRQFNKDGELNVNGHGDYPEAARKVAEELGIPFIDAKTISQEWLQSIGDEASIPYYMWVEPGTNPLHPDGKQDDTHTNERGAKKIVELLLPAIIETIPELAGHVFHSDFVVAKDGSGDFFTVQDAVNAAPDYLKEGGCTIRIRPGVYKEKVIIPASKERLHIVGDDPATTVITYDNYAEKTGVTGRSLGTSATPTVYFYADDLLVENITFENTSGEGEEIGQACAVMIDADRCAFLNCRFVANQDTIYTYGDNQHQYFKDCWIEGTTDFIFGYSTAWFENCTILSKKNSFITAASTLEGRPFGYVFHNCRLIASPEATNVYLGRPWRQFAKTVFLDCEMGPHILPEGWHNWDKPYAEGNVYYAEHGSTGPGFTTAEDRVPWSRQLTDEEAEVYKVETVLDCGAMEDKNGVFVPVEWHYKVF